MSETRSTIDSIFDVCQHQHRRIVLALLAAEGRSMTLNDLTKSVLEYNHQASPATVSEDVLSEIRLSLHHVHLPKLASEGYITYDPDRQFVEPTEQFEQVQPTVSTILDVDPTLETPVELKC
ncbi:hypothetical protein BRD00_13620 [Halobacteriales archaeon QS_8_69_26]|nr:MAG: hypothetical protein BRD00_13620 [Halobacteriales archaeon QS_8_69_26]